MTISISATVVPGQGGAAANHGVLIPRIAAHFPAVAKCSTFGTINVKLDGPLDRSLADFWTPKIAWIPARFPSAERALRLEAFGFIKVLFECPAEGPRYPAFIILAEGSELTYRDDSAEIITDTLIPGVCRGTRCVITIDHSPAFAAPSWFGESYGRCLAR